MSITAHPHETTQKVMSKKMIHWKNDSGEIDVFEAAKYFSAANEEYYQNNKQQNLMRSSGRMSLDMPMLRNSPLVHHQPAAILNKKNENNNKKYKQPSSPGGRLASFLNSLLSSKKKKSSSKSSAQSLKDEDESPGGRRKRRSSISHFSFRSSSIITESNKSSNSGFKTPPPYAYTPTKSYVRTLSHDPQQQVISLPISNKKTTTQDYSWLDDKLKLTKNGAYYKCTNNGLSDKNKTHNKVVDFDDDDDDGADSDSSSDLFDLPNIDLDKYSSSGLPVYETTYMDNIKRGVPISS